MAHRLQSFRQIGNSRFPLIARPRFSAKGMTDLDQIEKDPALSVMSAFQPDPEMRMGVDGVGGDGVPRVDDRCVLDGIFWVLRSGAPWRDLPDSYGRRTACYGRLPAAHDAAVQTIDISIVRVDCDTI